LLIRETGMGADLELVVGGRPVRFPAVWLRDNCPCPGCVAPGTGQKLNDITDIPNGLAITRTEDAGGVRAGDVRPRPAPLRVPALLAGRAGGPMTAEQAAAFAAMPYARDAVAVRRWDDEAKDPSVTPPPFGHFEPLLISLSG
jgi:hypothetical protein